MRIAVAGAGIGGLTAALALARAGHEVAVFERVEALAPVGAGLQLSPNALDVLHRLGVASRLTAHAVPADVVTLRRGGSGRVIARVPVGSSDGRGYLSLLRADLQDALVACVREDRRITLCLGHEVASIERGADWRLRFAAGQSEQHFDLLVAADGVHSRIATLCNRPQAQPSGASAVRLRAPHSPSHGIEAWLGARRHAVAYSVAAGRETNLVLVVPDREANAPAESTFRRWDNRLRDLIGGGEPLGVWPLLTREPHWREADLAFVGDAAHAMLPYAAQGAAMAIEDGWVLATCLARTADVEAGLRCYEAERAGRVAQVVRRVAFHRLVYHLPTPLSFGRDVVLAATPEHRLRGQLAWLYDWRARPSESVPA